MKRHILFAFALLALSATVSAQIPLNTHIQILKAEDARRYDKTLEDLLKSRSAEIRKRAALAAGRIGRDEALPTLTELLDNDSSEEVREMAAFALGEIESIKAADAVLNVIGPGVLGFRGGRLPTHDILARLLEAAGKIAAANATDPKAKELGKAINDAMEAELAKGGSRNREIVLLALTAALRAKPQGTDKTVAKFLTHPDARIRADAANTLSRLRAKNANETLRTMVASDPDPIARANAARALGAAEDKDAVEVLTNAALRDADSRVRVSAIRSLIPLRDMKVIEHLINRGRELMKVYEPLRKKVEGPSQVLPTEKNELLEIATALGRLLANTKHDDGWEFLEEFRYVDKHYSPEIEIAMSRVDPEKYLTVSNIGGVYLSRRTRKETYDWRVGNNRLAALSEYAAIAPDGPLKDARAEAQKRIEDFINAPLREFPKADPASAYPTIATAIGALARFRPTNMNQVALVHSTHANVAVRSSAASVIGNLPKSDQNVAALKAAFAKALESDLDENDAQLAILDALYKVNKEEGYRTFLLAATASADYLVRKRAFELLADNDLAKNHPELGGILADAKRIGKREVLAHVAGIRTTLGQVLNSQIDYRRALSRKNGTVKAVLTTDKGAFAIDFFPEEAPLTVDNFIKLARSGYFNGVEVHRVVPNFVMQDGDPTGTGSGGPGWSIRCEVNTLMYERGMVGMALSGKDTGGSQWFVTHSPQPHLDGGYTIFGKVNEAGMKIVDNIVRGDKILTVRIIGR